eukprot:360981-Chlamydomonas_euryale.AAC.1
MPQAVSWGRGLPCRGATGCVTGQRVATRSACTCALRPLPRPWMHSCTSRLCVPHRTPPTSKQAYGLQDLPLHSTAPLRHAQTAPTPTIGVEGDDCVDLARLLRQLHRVVGMLPCPVHVASERVDALNERPARELHRGQLVACGEAAAVSIPITSRSACACRPQLVAKKARREQPSCLSLPKESPKQTLKRILKKPQRERDSLFRESLCRGSLRGVACTQQPPRACRRRPVGRTGPQE